MALIKCIECGKEFSEYAQVCPNCGCPTEVILKNTGATPGNLSHTGDTISQNDGGAEKQTPVQQTGGDVASLLRRGELFLEDGEWKSADEYFEKVLDIDPECAEAYIGKLLAKKKLRNREQLLQENEPFDQDPLFQKAVRFGESSALEEYIQYNNSLREKIQHDLVVKKNMKLAAKLIAAGGGCTVGLKSDGTVVGTRSITDTYEISALNYATVAVAVGNEPAPVGLKDNGTVVSSNQYAKDEEFTNWRDVVSVYVHGFNVVGLRSNGTVVAAGTNMYGECNTANWRDIIAVAAGSDHIVGLKSNGTVVAVGDNGNAQCNVTGWKNIIAVAACNYATVGLRSNGTVIYTSLWTSCSETEFEETEWKDIVAIAAGGSHIVGLKSDGTVVATGNNEKGQCNTSNWRDVIAIAAGGSHTVGLKIDGTVLAVGNNTEGQCDVSSWKLFDSIETLRQEFDDGKARWQFERKREEWRRQAEKEKEERLKQAEKEEEEKRIKARREKWDQECETLTAKAAEAAKSLCHEYLEATQAASPRASISDKLKRGLEIPQIEDSQVYLSHDDTLFKTGKAGFAVTYKGIYCRDSFKKPQFLSYKKLADVKRISIDQESYSIHIDNFTLPIVSCDRKDKIVLLQLFENIVKAVQDL